MVYLLPRCSRLPSNYSTIYNFKQVPTTASGILTFGSNLPQHTPSECVRHLHCALVFWSLDMQGCKARKGNLRDATGFMSVCIISILHLKKWITGRWDYSQSLSSFLDLPDKCNIKAVNSQAASSEMGSTSNTHQLSVHVWLTDGLTAVTSWACILLLRRENAFSTCGVQKWPLQTCSHRHDFPGVVPQRKAFTSTSRSHPRRLSPKDVLQETMTTCSDQSCTFAKISDRFSQPLRNARGSFQCGFSLQSGSILHKTTSIAFLFTSSNLDHFR